MSLNMKQQCSGGLRRHSRSPSYKPAHVFCATQAQTTKCHATSPAQRDMTRPKLFQQTPQDLSADDEDGFLLDPLDDLPLHGVSLLHDASSVYQPSLTAADDDQPTTTTDEDVSDRTLSSIMSTALTQEELEVIQRHLTQGPQAGSSSNADDSTIEEEGGASQFPPDFWATDRERVFLVGVDILGRKFENQTNAAKANSNMWGNGNGKAANADSNGGGAGSVALRKRRVPVKYSVHDSLEELARLADTAGLKVVGSTYQALEVPNNSTYIGSGKVAEVARAMRAYKAETVIFDCELTPGQLRQLEKSLAGENGEVRVGDRTALILDIFSQRAATREGKLQVELAQTEYQLPRLTRMWTHLDRVGGGGQVKGTGEKQIETDKRILRDRAAVLRKELEAVRGHRRAYRERRAVAPIPVVALVGYTNAGKSTLLNRLTDAGVLAEDKLFATLDPTTRKIRTRGNRELLVTDTVGFIQKLPTELVAAFRATLEEVQDAGVLLHLVDISHPNAAAQCEAVLQVLDDLGVADIPLVTAWNKLDACPDPDQVRAVAGRRRDTVCVSGQTGEGVEQLLALITEKLSASMTEVKVCLPYAAGDLLDEIHKAGELLAPAEYTDTGINVSARVPAPLVGRLRAYSVLPVPAPPAPAPKLMDTWDGAEAELHLPLSLGVGALSVDCAQLDCTGLW